MAPQPNFIPGPWWVEPRDDCSGFKLYDVDGDLIDYLSDSRWIDDRADPEMVASAQLIAAAPELYAVLMSILEDEVANIGSHNRQRAFAVTRKARGESVSA